MNVWSTPSTASLIATPATATLTLIVVLTCVALLIQKEIAGSLDNTRAQQLNTALNVALLPLLLVLVSAIITRLAPFFT